MSAEERWLPVPGLPDYEVSDTGRVRSKRPPNGRNPPAGGWKIVKGSRRKRSGYVFVGLAAPGGDKTRHVGLHRVILEAFVGPCPEGMECRHLNGIRHDNRLENLAWGTPKENAADREAHGTHPRGERSPNAKLTASGAMRVWRLRAEGRTLKEIAGTLGISESAARDVGRRTWKHVVGGD